jgi:hypothetical protein
MIDCQTVLNFQGYTSVLFHATGNGPSLVADASKFHRMPGESLNGFSSVDGMFVNGAKLTRAPGIILRGD